MTNPFKGGNLNGKKDENSRLNNQNEESPVDKETFTEESEDTIKAANKEVKEETGSVTETADADNTETEAAPSELDKVKADFEQLNNQYIRLAADFENYRKRQEQERENLIRYGAVDTLKKLLEVLDNFDRGETALESVDDCKVVKDNFNLLHKQVMDILGKMGLEVIEAEGKEFDPNFHEAVMQTPSTEHPEHTVIKELQKGYKLGDKVLRPTLVNVAVAE